MNTIQDIQIAVNLLKQFPAHPELILSELRKEKHELNIINLIYNTETDGHDVLFWLKQYLQEQLVFSDCEVDVQRHRVTISFPDFHGIPLRRMINLDIHYGTYDVRTGIVLSDFKEVFSEQPVLDVLELDEYWKMFENFNWKTRFKMAGRAMLRCCFTDVFLAFTISEEKVNKALNAEKARIARINECKRQRYEAQKAKYELYNAYGEACDTYVKNKVEEIVKWLEERNFVKEE